MVSIKDVAERAGVSNSTVSRVLANKPHVSGEVRQKVMRAAEELDYSPYQTAQRLRSQADSRLIGLLISGVLNNHFNAIIHGVSDLAYSHKMHLLFGNAVGDVERERYYMSLMRSERVAGIIVNPQDQHNDGFYLDELRRSGMAVVLLDTSVDGYAFDCVTSDNRQGAARAVGHLVRLGHKRIATIVGKMTVTTSQERLAGYIDALRENNLLIDEELIKNGMYENDTAYEATLALLDLKKPPTALFVSNEPMTVGALAALRDRGVRIPNEMAVVTFDETPWSPHVDPPLTTVAQSTYAMGREAVRLLLRRLAEPDSPPLSVTLPTELVVRRSCGDNSSNFTDPRAAGYRKT
jgi:DNA-binding LacI/PurR family transcriptional regulator